MQSIKILHLITELDTGGAQKALARLLAHLDRERFAPHVACLYNGDKPVAQEIRTLDIPVTNLGMTAHWRLDALWRFYRLLRQERPMILHAWMFHANMLARVIGQFTRVPIIITSRRNVEIGGASREQLKHYTRSLDHANIAVCELARQAEIERTGVAPNKVITIYNGIETAPFEAASTTVIRAQLNLPSTAPIVGTVGRLHPQKGLPYLLTAFREINAIYPNAHLLVVGAGELRAVLESQAQQLGISHRVIFTGNRQDIPDLLACVDIFVLPSLWEGLPNVVLEAMAAGLPVVATAVGGTPEVVVNDVTGLLIPPRDPQALADAIHRLLRDPELRQRMGQAGRARVAEHFSVEQMVRKTETLYEHLLAEKGLA